jgi:preprotein translocase subunit SecD
MEEVIVRDNNRTRTAGVIAVLLVLALGTGCSTGDPDITLEVRIVQGTRADNLTRMSMTVWGGRWTYYAHDEVLLTEEDVVDAVVVKQHNGAPAMRLILSRTGQEKLHHATRNNVGNKLGVIINGRLQSVSSIEKPVDTGIVVVAGHMLEHGAERCSRALTRDTA